MDIAYLSPYVYPFLKGGVEKRIHEIGSRLVVRDHNVTIYSRNWWGGDQYHNHNGMTFRSIGPVRDLYADGDRRSIPNAFEFAARLLLPIVRHGRTHDLFVTPVAPYFHVFTGRFASLFSRTPLVVTWHEVWNGYWYDYMGYLGAVGKLTESLVGNVPHHPVAPSETTAEKLQALPSINHDVTVIPNGIDTDRIQTTPPATDGFDILFVGRLIEDKNVHLLLEALDRINTDATLGIIGDGPQYDTLRRQVTHLDCRDRVTFLGFLDKYDDVLAHMRAADLFVFPSIREGFGITLIEAMAADCTVITVDHSHSAGSEVVGDAGFVTEPTVERISTAIERALTGEKPSSNPVIRASKYDWDEVTTQTEQYFERVVE